MNDQPPGGLSARFNLSEFVIGYLEEAGSVVMPPEFGIYEVLMPEDVADGLLLDDYVRLAFTPPAPREQEDGVLRLNVNHPLVESIAETISRQPANARTFVRGVRTDKQGLAKLARQHLGLANARIDELPEVEETVLQHHYLLFNFKVTLLSDEKREELAVIVMDVQAGHTVDEPAIVQRLEMIDPTPAYEGFPVAPPRWQGAGEALAPDTFQALLPRAETALRQKLAGKVAALAARMERQLMLDLARIGDYYDEMAADLQRRQTHLAPDDVERRQSIAEKIEMLEAERTSKFADAQSRYSLRVDMELVNVLLATQAKVTLRMSISNRTATISRTVVWDPLVHRLEPLVCDVCGKPGETLHLCTGGHLAHTACLAPQCVDCKRAFCQLCAAEITECVVCHRPVCRHSLIECPTCGRGTCSEHQQLCHAADGQPATLPEPSAPEGEEAASPPPAAQQANRESPAQTRSNSRDADSTRNAAAKRRKAKSSRSEKRAPTARGVRIDVQIYDEEPVVVAFVMRSTNRILATRTIGLTMQGILIQCDCEKDPCASNGIIYRPASSAQISEQVEDRLNDLRQEYRVPSKKVNYLYQRFGQIRAEKRLVLPEAWRDPELLTQARRGFDLLEP